jgi:CHAD domain-containing protein
VLVAGSFDTVPNPSTAKGSRETEIEWQLDALDLRPAERWLAERSGPGARVVLPALPGLTLVPEATKRLVDAYVDTEDWRVGRSGYVLRLRKRGGHVEATLKDLAPPARGLRRRFEATEALPGGSASPLSALDPSGPVGRRVRALAGSRRFREILEVRTRRRPFTLMIAGEAVGEIALDDTTIGVASERRRLRLQRVEVEVLPGYVEALSPLVDQLRSECGLQSATLSKFEAGLMAAGLTIPRLPDLGPTSVDARSVTGDVAFAVLRRDAAAMISHEPGTRLGEDIEALHQMRVSTRRMRAALDLFADVLPARALHFRSELGWLADALGRVRDLDIQLGHFDGWIGELHGQGDVPLGELAALLTQQRELARTDMLEALDSRRYERLVVGLVAMLKAGPMRRSPASRQPAIISMVPLIETRHRAAVKAATRARRTGIASDYHRLRIRGKRLRYSLDFTTGLYDNQLRAFGRQLAKLQDELGLMQDAEVAAERLRHLALSPEGAALSRDTVFIMGSLAERYRAESEQRLLALPPFVGCLTGREAKKALSAMARHKAEVEAEQERLALEAAARRAGPRDAERAPARRPVRLPGARPLRVAAPAARVLAPRRMPSGASEGVGSPPSAGAGTTAMPATAHPSAAHPSAAHPSAGHPSNGHPSADHPANAGHPPLLSPRPAYEQITPLQPRPGRAPSGNQPAV